MLKLPPEETPLNQHSLVSLENWLHQLGAERDLENPCVWRWFASQWSAEIQIERDELTVVWNKGGKLSQCAFPYGLSRSDVEKAMAQGP